jgi:hypothetical protein
MDNFECSVKDLLDNKHPDDSSTKHESKHVSKREEKPETNTETNTENKTKIITATFLNKLSETSSIRIIFTILIMYLILNSNYVNELIFNTFPYLMNSSTESNLLGKIIISLIIGISTILTISFLPAP